LFIRQLEHFPSVYGVVVNEISRMKKSRYKDNCQRFFEDMPEANNALFERLTNVNFI
jgi:hypothetical protein